MEPFAGAGLSLAELEEMLRLAMYELVEIQQLPPETIELLVPCSVGMRPLTDYAVMWFAHYQHLDLPVTSVVVPRKFLAYLVATHEEVHHARS